LFSFFIREIRVIRGLLLFLSKYMDVFIQALSQTGYGWRPPGDDIAISGKMCHNVPVMIDKGSSMVQKKDRNNALPPEVSEAITIIGKRIRIARKRRGLTMEKMASRMFVTRKTLARLEKGDPGVSLAVLSSALWVLGLDDDLKNIAVPEQDSVGIFHERKKLPKRVRSTRRDDLDF